MFNQLKLLRCCAYCNAACTLGDRSLSIGRRWWTFTLRLGWDFFAWNSWQRTQPEKGILYSLNNSMPLKYQIKYSMGAKLEKNLPLTNDEPPLIRLVCKKNIRLYLHERDHCVLFVLIQIEVSYFLINEWYIYHIYFYWLIWNYLLIRFSFIHNF